VRDPIEMRLSRRKNAQSIVSNTGPFDVKEALMDKGHYFEGERAGDFYSGAGEGGFSPEPANRNLTILSNSPEQRHFFRKPGELVIKRCDGSSSSSDSFGIEPKLAVLEDEVAPYRPHAPKLRLAASEHSEKQELSTIKTP